eukprot:1156724-Pelagomonas_calceolata.AAC.2
MGALQNRSCLERTTTVGGVPKRAPMDQVIKIKIVSKRRGCPCAAVVAVRVSSGASEYGGGRSYPQVEISEGSGDLNWIAGKAEMDSSCA